MLKVARDGTFEVFAAGFRQPDGIAVNPVGEIFMVDGEGQWLPSCKLIHVQQGRYYGHPAIHASATPWDESIPESPPAIWVPHPEIGLSNSQPVFLDTGLYKGQMLAADVTYGGIQRYFLEKVQGEYQGAVFQFTGGLECGMNTTQIGPDGAIYTGGLGAAEDGAGSFGWRYTRFGLQKLVPNGNAVFEMLAVRSLEDGFSIEFTKPPGTAALQASNYTIERGGFRPVYDYGAGDRINRREVPVLQVASLDEKTVKLTVDPGDLQHDMDLPLMSTCFHFALNGITSEQGEALWSAEAFYTLNFIGPAQVVGCMDIGYEEYDPLAQYDDGFRCVNQISEVRNVFEFSSPGLSCRLNGGFYEIDVSIDGPYILQIADVKGKTWYVKDGNGEAGYRVSRSQAPAGLHFISLKAGARMYSGRMLVY
jgi:hypothetical protein